MGSGIPSLKLVSHRAISLARISPAAIECAIGVSVAIVPLSHAGEILKDSLVIMA